MVESVVGRCSLFGGGRSSGLFRWCVVFLTVLLAQLILDIILVVVILPERILSCLLLSILNIFTLLSVHDLVVGECLERSFIDGKW